MWNPWIVVTVVAIAGASAIASFSRHWLIGALVFGIGTPVAVAIGDEIVSGRHNRFIAVVIVFAWFLTVPAALLASYLTFRFRQSRRTQEGRSNNLGASRAPPNNRWRGP